VNKKPAEYAGLGVKEYFVFDPEGKYLDPVLQGFRTVKGKAVPMKPAADGSLVSKQLGLRLVAEGEMLRLIDMETGEPIPTKDERNEQDRQRAAQADQRAAQERQLREQAEQRAEELEAELRRLRQPRGNHG
jgi:hypothetical protein